MSATTLVCTVRGAGLKDPVSRARNTAAMANATAEPPNANAIATPARIPPSGGPTNWFIVSSTAYSRPFAWLRRSFSTTLGMIDCAAVSNSVSPMPSTNAAMYSSGRLTKSPTIEAAITIATPLRRIATATMVRRRSRRSASAPATSTKRSHGRRPTTATPAIRAGESVSVIASSGNAIQNTPSARFDTADADHRRQ